MTNDPWEHFLPKKEKPLPEEPSFPPKAAERHATRQPWPEFDDRPRCINHHQPEPCGICASYIAAGL